MSDLLRRATYYLAFASAASILFSIALSQTLLTLALASLLLSGEKLRFPRIGLPLTLFFLTTLAALLASGDPQSGTPQIRKFFIFAIALVICSSFQTVRQVQALVLVWAGAASLSAMLGLAQFLQRRQEALEQNADNYGFFVDGRITGFAGHWMTFGGEQMIVFLMLASFLLFSGSRTWKLLFWPLLLLMWAAITLGMTRCIFLLGLPAGMIYLLWRLRPAYAMALPLVAAVGLAAAPATVHERIVSAFKPHGDVDSNAHRAVCRATGWEMVKAHPWLGLGPEQVGKQFDRYVPARINRPLPHGWYGHLHNIYLQYAAERGIPALVCFLWLIGKSMLDFLRRLSCSSTTREARFVLHGAVAVIIAVLAEGIFEYNLGDSEVLTLFLSAIACGYVAIERDNTTPEAARESAAEPVEDALPCVPSIGA